MSGPKPVAASPGARFPAAEAWLRWLCVLAALAAAVPGLRLVGLIWSRSEYLAHGYMIPIVSLALVYARRAQIRTAVREGDPPALGPLCVLAAAIFEMGAVAGEVATVAAAGIPLLLAATAYAVGGVPLLRAAGLPIAFIFLMVPPPLLVEDRVLLGLKLFVTQTAATLLRGFGYSVAATGNHILIPGHELFVEDACSGLNSIATLFPISVVVAYFLSHGIWRRLVLVSSIVPLAMLGNIARVVLAVILVSGYGIESAEGLLHESLGLATFVLGTLALLLVARVLR